MSEIKTADVIIIGAGIAGNSAAYYAAKRGLSCIVLESDMIGHGGSSRNGGGVRRSGRDAREMPLANFAINNLWPNLKDELGMDVEFRQKGYLACGYDESHEKNFLERVKVGKSFGIDVYVMREDEIYKEFPYLSKHVKFVAWTPSDGVANPMLATLAFYKRAREMGVHFITGEKALKIETVKGRARRVITERGNVYEGESIVIAAGFHSRKLLNTVGVDVPIYPRLHNALITEPIAPVFEHMIGGVATPVGYYGQQMKHGSFVLGGSSGREICNFFDQESEKTNSVSPVAICNFVGRDFPLLNNLKVIRAWGGWEEISIDGVPVIGVIDEVPGLSVACGSSGHGFCLGPAVGYTLAELAAGLPATVDITKLHYDRFDYFKSSAGGMGAKIGH